MYGVLQLDMREKKGIELVKYINTDNEILPDLKLIAVRYIGEDNEDIKTLLMNSVVKSKSLFFNNHVLPEFRTSKIDIGNYMEALMSTFPKIEKEVFFYYMKINAKQFSSIVKNWSHLKRIGFIKCKISVAGGVEFTKQDLLEDPYKIESFNFKGWGDGYRGGIITEADFDKIIKAMSESTLKNSLQRIRTNDLNIEKREIEKILSKYGMEKVEIQQTDLGE